MLYNVIYCNNMSEFRSCKRALGNNDHFHRQPRFLRPQADYMYIHKKGLSERWGAT